MTPKAMSKNIAKEMEAGKPQRQAVAIAYSVKREAEKAKKASPKKKWQKLPMYPQSAQ